MSAEATPAAMPAWQQHRYGDAAAVMLADAAVPSPAPGQVLVRLRATGRDNGDVRVMRGEPLLVRLAFDAVLDIAGTAPLRVLRRLVRDGGRVVLVSGEGGRVLGPIGRLLRAGLLSIGSKRPLVPLAATPKTDVLARLAALAAAREIRPVIERIVPLSAAGDALAEVADGHVTGKIVVLAD